MAPLAGWLVLMVAPLLGSPARRCNSCTTTTAATAISTMVASVGITTPDRSPRRALDGVDCAAVARVVESAAGWPATVSATPTLGWPVRAVAKSEQLGYRSP